MNNHIFADSYQVTEDGETYWRIFCKFCQAASINGVPTHERGCPQDWRDELRECGNCDAKFYPEERDQFFCDEQCAAIYRGDDLDEDDLPDGWIICRECSNECEPYEPGEEFCSERCAKEFWG